MLLKIGSVAVILILVVLLEVVCYHIYNVNQLTAQPKSTSGSPSTSQSPESGPTSSSPITITTLTQAGSSQSAYDLKLSIYGNDPSKSPPQTLQTINWSAYGPLMPGQSMNSSKVYFRNEGNVPISLYLSTSDWAFQDVAGKSLSQSYQQYFTLTWDYDNSKIAVNETRSIIFTLAISQNIIDVATFSFSIIVTAT